RAFGNQTLAAERFYESNRWTWWGDLIQDVKYACRALRRNPGFAITAALILALGIGANTGIFSVINAVLLKPLPYPNPDRLVALHPKLDTGARTHSSPADFLDYQSQAHSFESMAAYRDLSLNVIAQAQPEQVTGAVVTPGFFSVLGIDARLGRALNPNQDKPGGARALVLGYALWRGRFGANPNIVGQSIVVDDEPVTVVGVMPEHFQFPAGVELWVSSRFAAPEHWLRPLVDNSTSRDSHYLDVVARLAPGFSLEQANVETATIASRLKQEFGDDELAVGVSAVPLHGDMAGETRPALLLMFGAVTLLLLIACVNVAGIILARGAARQKEIATRIALGAGRLRLARQVLTETVVLSALGGSLGVLLAYSSLPFLRTFIPRNELGGGVLKLDGAVLALTALISLACGIFFGLFPALQLAGAGFHRVLKGGGRGMAPGLGAPRTRSALVASEIALATVLLIGAGLLIRSFGRLSSVREGFNPDHVLSLRLSLPHARYPKETDRADFVNKVIERIRAVPGIRSAAAISWLPLSSGRATRGMDIKGRAAPPSGDIAPDYLVITPDYFQSLGIPLLAGRTFTDKDNSSAQTVVIINQAAARYFWPNQDAIGQLVTIGATKDWSPVVGVVADVEQHRLDQPPPPAVYLPYAQDPWSSMSFVVNTAVDPASATGSVASAIHSVDKDEPLYAIQTMNDLVVASVSSERMRMTVIGAFALAALVLASVGVYGVIAHAVSQRTNEIGLRMALGARQGDLLNLVVGYGLKMALAGVFAGLMLSFALARFLSGLLFGVAPTDAGTFAVVSCLLTIVALAASYIPAWRATRIDPVVALRAE
ncbi:MAG TPA: ABC transporter permease, partial [Blastocatellia bacterium]|nr:ABC transporter permease [Blastocatellia bacterium]